MRRLDFESNQIITDSPLVCKGAKSILDACRFTGLSRSGLYALMDSGRLHFCKVGKRRLIPVVELERLLSEGLASGK